MGGRWITEHTVSWLRIQNDVAKEKDFDKLGMSLGKRIAAGVLNVSD